MLSRWKVKFLLLVLALYCHLVMVGAFGSLQPLRPRHIAKNHGPILTTGWKHHSRKPSIQETTIVAAQKENKDDKQEDSWLATLQEKPGTLIAAPFVILVGLDLLVNIFFLTKRTIEYFALGKLPSTEVWFSDNLFL